MKTKQLLLTIGIALIVGCMAMLAGAQTSNPVSGGIPDLLTNGIYVYKFYGQFDQALIPAGGNTANDINALARDLMSVTNFVGYAGGGYALSGPKTYLADVGVVYNINNYVGLVAGYDWLRIEGKNGVNQETANVIKGGCTLSYSFPAPVFTNVMLTPYGLTLVATPTKGTDNNGGVGLITAFGMGETLWHDKSLSLKLTEGFENRTGEGAFDRNYLTLDLAIAYGF
jgi:hypothetical protein